MGAQPMGVKGLTLVKLAKLIKHVRRCAFHSLTRTAHKSARTPKHALNRILLNEARQRLNINKKEHCIHSLRT